MKKKGIICFYLNSGIAKRFTDIKEASEKTHIPEKRIEWCIRTGNKWKTLTFDLL